MKETIQSYLPLLGRYKIEAALLTISLIITLISGGTLLASSSTPVSEAEMTIEPADSHTEDTSIIVHIDGAVEEPGVYSFPSGSRVNDAVDKAGGLTADAAYTYYIRTFNLAKILVDQDKIYVPTATEIANNEESSVIDVEPQTMQINVNTASLEELDSLPGVGKITAQKIIDARPYSSLEDFEAKKVVKKNTLQTIKNRLIWQ